MGEPTIAINANFFDVRGQKGGSWRTTGCSSPLGAQAPAEVPAAGGLYDE